MEVYVSQFLIFVMLFARVTALIVVAPILGHQSIPVQIKVAIGLFLAFVMYPNAAGTEQVVEAEFLPIVIMALKEVIVGLIIGFATGLIFAGVRYAGDLIAMDIGISMAAMFDPESNTQSSIISEFLYLTMAMIFLLLNGHHFVLEALHLSYAAVPIGGLAVTGAVSAILIKLTGMTFVIAAKLAAPIMVSMFLINLAVSILSRVMPQMNIFAVVFPVKIGVGFFVVMVSIPLLAFVFQKLLSSFEANILELVKVM
ncbi:MAG: flagellar biosynthetic protein FliR [Ignavibacteriae bacterium]|nr:flagellar biosynthetic protein FliR [Ignavibacteriota bacterium]